MDSETLATEMIREIRASSKRWFIAFIVTLCLWFATIIGFVLYEYYSLPVEETSYEQSVDDIQDSEVNQTIGGDSDGESKTESDTEE